MKWIQRALDRNQWLVLDNTDVSLWVPYKRWGTSWPTWVSVSGDINMQNFRPPPRYSWRLHSSGMLHKGLYFKLWLNNKHKNCHMPDLFLEVWPHASRIRARVTVRIFKIYFNVNLPSTPRSYKLSLSLRFPHQNPLCISLLPQKSHMPNQPPTFFLTICWPCISVYLSQ